MSLENKSPMEENRKLHPKHLGRGCSASFDGLYLIIKANVNEMGGQMSIALNAEQTASLSKYIDLIFQENHR